MIKVSATLHSIKNDVELTDNEKAILVNYVKMEGFAVIQKLIEDQINKFNQALLNANPADHNAVLSDHVKAQTAAQIWVGLADRINAEIELYQKNFRNFKEPEIPVQIEEFR